MLNGKLRNPNNFLVTSLIKREREREKERRKRKVTKRKRRKKKIKSKREYYPPISPPRGRSASRPASPAYARVK